MNAPLLDSLVKQAEGLTSDELLDLVERLVEKARQQQSPEQTRLMWRDLAGIAPRLLDGEDAQAWVSRTRRESDESRELVWTKRE